MKTPDVLGFCRHTWQMYCFMLVTDSFLEGYQIQESFHTYSAFLPKQKNEYSTSKALPKENRVSNQKSAKNIHRGPKSCDASSASNPETCWCDR